MEKSLQKLVEKIGEKIGEKSVEKSVEKLVEKSVEKGKGAKEKSGISLVFNQTGGGGGVSKGRQKSKTQVCKCIFSVSMQNHSRTPKTCFTLGLVSLLHI